MKIYLDYLKSCKVLDTHPEGYIDLDEITTGSVEAKIRYVESNYLSKNARVATIDGKYQVVPSGKLDPGYVTVSFKSKDDDKTRLKMYIDLTKVTERTMQNIGQNSEIEAIHADVKLYKGKDILGVIDLLNIDLGDIICDDIRKFVYDHGYTEYNSVVDLHVSLSDNVANSTYFRYGIDSPDQEEMEYRHEMNNEALKCTVIRYLTTTFKCGVIDVRIVIPDTDLIKDRSVNYEESKGSTEESLDGPENETIED